MIKAQFCLGTNSHKDSFEGFKSYGNPQSGETVVMYFDKESLISNNPPTKPTWEIVLQNLSGIAIKEIIKENSFVIATKTNNEEVIAKIIKINNHGKIIWSKKVSKFGEITDIDVSSLDGERKWDFNFYHKHMIILMELTDQ